MSLHPAIQSMLTRYNCKTKTEYKYALKEIIQEVTLLGLARAKFFDKAAFYGGTALRITHGLDRFSEDLDFEKRPEVKDFDLTSYLPGIADELRAYGLDLTVEKRDKKDPRSSSIDSAFLKGNTVEHLLKIENIENPLAGFSRNDQIKIRLEVDTDPPSLPASTEVAYHNEPIPFQYRVLDLPSLYAGKLHAIICRSRGGGRVKGRDFYDHLWYQRKKITPNYDYLQAKLIQTGAWPENKPVTSQELRSLLEQRFEQVNWEQAKEDVMPFVPDPFALEVWSKEFFRSTLRF